MSLTNLLLGALNPATQKQSEDALKRAELQNYPEYLKALATELADPSKPPLALRSAGVILKNAFYEGRSESARQRKIQNWNNIDDQVRAYIQQCVLKSLVSPVDEARKSAAQVIGSLGAIELDQKRWPELVPALFAYANSTQFGDDYKVQIIQSMGYLCEMLSTDSVSEQDTNSLLTAMVDCMAPKRLDQLKLAAISALLNTLDFAQANMNRVNERNLIMQKICESAVSPDLLEMRCVAFDCMTKVAELYYDHFNIEYLNAIGSLTFAAIRGKDEKVALRALEFWMTLCEIETDLKYEQEENGNQQVHIHRFIFGACQPLVDLITTTCLKRQSEELLDDEDEWNLSMAGGMLLTLMAQCEGDEVLKFAMPFVQANLPLTGPEQWRSREAGLMAFGSVLDGPHPSNLQMWIVQALPFIFSSMDQNREPLAQVRDTAAWCLGIICQYHYDLIKNNQGLGDQIAMAFLQGLKDPEAIVASKCAAGFQNLGAAYEHEQDSPRNKLSDYLKQVLPTLIATSQRPDADRGDLRRECFEAVNALVTSSAHDMLPILNELLQVVLQQLHGALSFKNIQSAAQKDELEDMIQSCCGTLQVIVRKLKTELQATQIDNIMTLVVQILTSHSHAWMDAHLVIGSVANATQRNFLKFFPVVMPHVIAGLRNAEDYQACQTATELVSDISRAVGQEISPVVPQLIPLLLGNLSNGELNRAIKAPSILALGDIALALNEQFEPYCDPVFLCLENATMMLNAQPLNGEDKDLTDFVNELRCAILETYTSILMSLGSQACHRVFLARSGGSKLDGILNELVNISREVSSPQSEISDDVVKAACGLMGDLAKELGQPAVVKMRSAFSAFSVILEYCKRSQDESLREVAAFTTQAVARH